MNIGANLVLIPAWGLQGAVVSTTVSTGTALVVLYWISRCVGMRLDSGTILLSAAPAALCGGVWAGSVVLVLLLIAAPFSRTLLTQDERNEFSTFGRVFWERWKPNWLRKAEQAEAGHAV